MKQKRYWLRGGITLTVISGVPLMIYVLMGLAGHIFESLSLPFVIIIYPGINLNPLTNQCFLNSPSCPVSQVMYSASIVIIILVFYFIVGAIIGLIWGRFKNRNKVAM